MQASGRTILLGIVLVALISVLTACGSADDGPSSDVSLFEQLLGAIPDTPDTRKSVTINNYAAARQIFGVPLPGPEADQSALEEYLLGFFNSSYMPLGPFIAGMGELQRTQS